MPRDDAMTPADVAGFQAVETTEETPAILDSPVYVAMAVPALAVMATVIGATLFGLVTVLAASGGLFGSGYPLFG